MAVALALAMFDRAAADRERRNITVMLDDGVDPDVLDAFIRSPRKASSPRRHVGPSGNGPGSRTYPVDDAALGTALRFVWLRSQVSSASRGRRCGGGFDTSGTGQRRSRTHLRTRQASDYRERTPPRRWCLQRRAGGEAVRPTRVKPAPCRRRCSSRPTCRPDREQSRPHRLRARALPWSHARGRT